MSKLRLTNSLSNQKEEFVPLKFPNVKMYVCGITPYDYPHLGHGRCYVTFDLLYRILKFLDYKVTYVRNFTDVEDKLIDRAKRDLGSGKKFIELASKFIKIFEEDMSRLNCERPNFEPRVTENITQIIEFISGLIEAGKAYVVNGDVYFSISNFKDYGKLSKRTEDDLLAGARVQVREEKHSPLDFALWKSTQDDVYWESPWGRGRPGWHIECSAMAKRYLGEQIDIHGGGMDLIFPHHENEIAQTEGLTGLPFAKYWLHNAFITVDKEKMSKSLGNFVTLREALDSYHPQILRYYFLAHHYRIPVDFSDEAIKSCAKAYAKICKHLENIEAVDFKYNSPDNNIILNNMLDFILDDMNVSGMLGIVFDNLKKIQEDKKLAGNIKFLFNEVLGLDLVLIKEKEVEITPEIESLILEREQARKEKNWARSDELRKTLHDLGYEVNDKKL